MDDEFTSYPKNHIQKVWKYRKNRTLEHKNWKKVKLKFSGRVWNTLSLTKSAETSYFSFQDQTAIPKNTAHAVLFEGLSLVLPRIVNYMCNRE